MTQRGAVIDCRRKTYDTMHASKNGLKPKMFRDAGAPPPERAPHRPAPTTAIRSAAKRALTAAVDTSTVLRETSAHSADACATELCLASAVRRAREEESEGDAPAMRCL